MRLINAVKNYPAIYDRGSPLYQQYKRKESAWHEIAAKIGNERTKCMKKWQTLQDSCSKQMERESSNWFFLKHMQFFVDAKRQYLARKYLEASDDIDVATAAAQTVGSVNSGVANSAIAAPSPSSDSNAMPQAADKVIEAAASASNNATSSLNALLATASPSPSGSDHLQSSAISQSNQVLLERLSSGTNIVGVATATAQTAGGGGNTLPNMPPHMFRT